MNYIDDILVFGINEKDHAIEKVKYVLKENDVVLNEEKCIWKT